MQNRFSYHNITKHYSIECVEKITFLGLDCIAIQETYGEDHTPYRKIGIYDLPSSKLITEILSSKCFISNMAFIKDHYFAVTYHEPPSYAHQLGIWDIRRIKEGESKPLKQFPITSSNYFPKLVDLGQQQIAYAAFPGNSVDVFNTTQKLFSFTAPYEFHFSLQLIRDVDGLMSTSMNELKDTIDVHILDLKTQQISKHFPLPIGGHIYQIDQLKILPNQDILLGYHCFDTNTGNTQYLNIWNRETKEIVKTLNNNIKKIKKFPNDDMVTISNKGIIEYWSPTFEKYPYEVKLSREVNFYREIELTALDNYALFIHHALMLTHYHETFMYVPPPLPLLQNQYRLVEMVANIIAPRYKIPQINRLIHEYLGFFKPKKYCGIDFPEEKLLTSRSP